MTSLLDILAQRVDNNLSNAPKARQIVTFENTLVFDNIDTLKKQAVIIGEDDEKNKVVIDFNKSPHILIGGSTGSGKSICIETILAYLMTYNSPASAKFIVIDPKVVSFPDLENSPFLIDGKPITNLHEVNKYLTLALDIMHQRYAEFEQKQVKNITEMPNLSHIYIIIDEIADLLLSSTAKQTIELIMRIAQLGRAAGIHLIIATQRLFDKSFPKPLKANIPTRIAFKTVTRKDSMAILDTPGAENLLGHGDALMCDNNNSQSLHFQGSYISTETFSIICDYWQNK